MHTNKHTYIHTYMQVEFEKSDSPGIKMFSDYDCLKYNKGFHDIVDDIIQVIEENSINKNKRYCCLYDSIIA